jgi:N-acetylmuramoyl-L-alanine amidase
MSGSLDRTKRRLLDGALRENVEIIRNAPPPGLVSRWRPRLRPQLIALLAVGLCTIGASAYVSVLRATSQPGAQAATSPPAPAWLSDATAPEPSDTAAIAAIAVGGAPVRPPAFDRATLQLGVHRIVVDAGHGGIDLGTVAPGLTEKSVTLDIAQRLRLQLELAGFEVVLTREDDHKLSLVERAQVAKSSAADLFLSIHVNWISERQVRGIETYYLGPTDDPFLNQLAASENRDSGYSLADFRSLVDGIYADARQEESRHLATAVQAALYRSLRHSNPQLADRGIKSAPFVVLVATEVPAILAEVSCLSNEAETRLLATPEYRQQIAEALAAGVTRYTTQRGTPPTAPSLPPSPPSPLLATTAVTGS